MDGRRKSTRPQFCDFWYNPDKNSKIQKVA